jgi:hypothetical protein
MKIVKIEKAVDAEWMSKPMFSVIYKMRGRGNKHYETALQAVDEMGAYIVAREQILENEEKAWAQNVEDMELLHKQFPKANYGRKLTYARKMLKDIRKEMGV